MIKIPNFKNSFEYENNFYLTCDNNRISKIITQYELYKRVSTIPGHIVECGVFKGTSLIRFATFRELFKNNSKKIIAFDTFGRFPKPKFSEDVKFRKKFNDGEESIKTTDLRKILKHKKIEKNIELIKGDIMKTLPKYLEKNPRLKISILNLDVDLYEPSKLILNNLFSRISKGGILILDNYNVYPGETKIANDFFKNKKEKIQKLQFRNNPAFVVKK